VSQSQNRDAFYAMNSQNRETKVMFIEYMMNKNKDSENCESIIEEFVRENANMRSNSPFNSLKIWRFVIRQPFIFIFTFQPKKKNSFIIQHDTNIGNTNRIGTNQIPI